MAAQRYAAIGRGKVKAGMGEKFASRIKSDALPVMRTMEGIKG
jgi:hypothetical protein